MATLLIVDDDTLIRETLHDLLSTGHECHTADRAEQALAYLDIENYDAVITDISMPGLSGREILKYVQAKQPSTPVIVISGNPDGADGESMVDMGAFAYITKPFQLDDIEDAVTRAIARHQELTTVPQDGQQSELTTTEES
jgi:DNA-binding NtrC family response regulator